MADPVRFYFDQHMHPAVANGLRRQGIDILTAQDAGRCGYADSDQLAYAAANDRVMVTFDTDYLGLYATGVSHAGVAWIDADKYAIGQLIWVLTLLHAVYSADELTDRLEYL